MTLVELEEAIKVSKEMAKKYSQISHIDTIERKNGNFGKTQFILSRYFTYLSPTWSTPETFEFEREFTLEELVLIFKGAVFIEIEIMGQLMGSVSSVDRIYTVIAREDYMTAKNMEEWLFHIGLGNYFSTHLVNYRHETLLASMFSKDPIERQAAINSINLHKEYIEQKNIEYSLYWQKIFVRKNNYERQKNRDLEDRKNGIREMFLNELNNLSLDEKLQQLASDDTHSPKYYPTSIVNDSTIEVLQNLDKGLLEKLLERMQIPLRKSPWKSFRNRLYSVTSTEPFHGVHKSFY